MCRCVKIVYWEKVIIFLQEAVLKSLNVSLVRNVLIRELVIVDKI